ncbi:MAG: UbiA family prenyltransferase [Promethearchaeota archaeon]
MHEKSKLRIYFDLTVPDYSILLLLNIMIYGLLFRILLPEILSLSALWVGLSLHHQASGAINSLFEIDLDRVSKPDRPLPAKRVSEKTVLLLTILLYALSFSSLSLLSFIMNNLSFLVAGIVLFILWMLYCSPRIYLKRKLFAGSLVGAIYYGGVPFILVWTLTNQESFPILLFVYIFALSFVIANTKDFEDYNAELELDYSTLPIKLGYTLALKLIPISLIVINFVFLVISLSGIMNFILAISYIAGIILGFGLFHLFRKENLVALIDGQRVVTQSKIVSAGMAYYTIVVFLLSVTVFMSGIATI